MPTALLKSKEAGPNLVPVGDLFESAKEILDAVAHRAYEIFQHKGGIAGRDLEDWFQAESELLAPVRVEITESDDALTVHAKVPGFKAKELRVSVEPRRLTMTGKKENKAEDKEGNAPCTESRTDQIFRAVDLPAEVNPEKVSATLNEGILQLRMKKMNAAKSRVVPIG